MRTSYLSKITHHIRGVFIILKPDAFDYNPEPYISEAMNHLSSVKFARTAFTSSRVITTGKRVGLRVHMTLPRSPISRPITWRYWYLYTFLLRLIFESLAIIHCLKISSFF
ncbi:hypothetical protein KsCSTR_46060 [Candidatus Kuenenia stuttgartiensis]|uniref:Uncharacterized protein n=1 Tax=Kuenenia stuttgartiensis TaxID=174633 RepID=Q1PWC6_KUEST|nr:hypothetical protein KsCSTR_46060 [Candidatus Kuenenia stuttgartiensis]CAJ71534.1 unknown protein [Candidatus Kuenenia stuttgartiensis]